jgi:hypothetical protein
MSISDQPNLVSAIMLDIKDQVYSDFLVSIWWFGFGMMALVDDRVIVINLGKL